ncbi:hypothetical protein EW026_g7157 [Hermanssonia centrifuga]|uniref:Uncharacterized protein n=1 Tax=Hermanssonia centrifuga TaxID=98765 RepID=A0A4S4KD61_9APHY|nr:hypothetical protein EW026_g7157 [Hermanssonia centrifuga]
MATRLRLPSFLGARFACMGRSIVRTMDQISGHSLITGFPRHTVKDPACRLVTKAKASFLRSSSDEADRSDTEDDESVSVFLPAEDSILDEEAAVKVADNDVAILTVVDAILSHDELLGTAMREALRQTQPQAGLVLDFVLRAICHRLPKQGSENEDLADMIPLDLQPLTRRASLAVADIATDVLEREITRQLVQHHNQDIEWEN